MVYKCEYLTELYKNTPFLVLENVRLCVSIPIRFSVREADHQNSLLDEETSVWEILKKNKTIQPLNLIQRDEKVKVCDYNKCLNP